jgi:hypothetical protein
MDDMTTSLKKTGIYIAVSMLFLLVIFAINQTAQLYAMTSAIHPYLGYLTLALLIAAFAFIIFIPLTAFLSLKRRPDLPASMDSPEYGTYIDSLKTRLQTNRYLKGEGFAFDETAETRIEVERALKVLNERADTIIKSNSSAVFLTTAISQNGSLDSIFVLSSITKMVWEIAHIYNQRPTFRDLVYLYGNIGATVIMARGIEDIDLLDEQLEPVLTSVLGGGLGSLIPGAVHITSLLVNSISEGSVNALLSLRVGSIAKRYSASTTKVDKRVIRRSATLEAVSLLGGIIKDNTVIIVNSFAKAAKRTTRKLLKF